MQAFAKAPELTAADVATLWITPIDDRPRLHAVRNWNRDHPDRPVLISPARDDWPWFDSWAIPSFHLLKDRRRLDPFEGWLKKGHREPLRALLKRAQTTS